MNELIESGALDIAVNSETELTDAPANSSQPAANDHPFDIGSLKISTKPQSTKPSGSIIESSKSNPMLKRGRRRKAPPKWVLPAIIAIMFVVLVVVLTVAFSLINKNNSSIDESQLPKYFHADFVGNNVFDGPCRESEKSSPMTT